MEFIQKFERTNQRYAGTKPTIPLPLESSRGKIHQTGGVWSKKNDRPNVTFLSAIFPHQMRPSDVKSEKVLKTLLSAVDPLVLSRHRLVLGYLQYYNTYLSVSGKMIFPRICCDRRSKSNKLSTLLNFTDSRIRHEGWLGIVSCIIARRSLFQSSFFLSETHRNLFFCVPNSTYLA